MRVGTVVVGSGLLGLPKVVLIWVFGIVTLFLFDLGRFGIGASIGTAFLSLIVFDLVGF